MNPQDIRTLVDRLTILEAGEPENPSRRSFLKKTAGAAAAVTAASLNKPAMIIAKELISSPTTNLNSLKILSSFIDILPKIGISADHVGEMMGQWSSGNEGIMDAFHLTYEEYEDLEKKLEYQWNMHNDGRDEFWSKIEPYATDGKYSGLPANGMPWKFGMPVEPLEKSTARVQYLEKILGYKTKYSMLNDWAKGFGFPSFQHLYASPAGKIILDNIAMLADIFGDAEDDDMKRYGQQANHHPYDPVNNRYYELDQVDWEKMKLDKTRSSEDPYPIRKDYDKSKYSGKVIYSTDKSTMNLYPELTKGSTPPQQTASSPQQSTPTPQQSTPTPQQNTPADTPSQDVQAALDTAKTAGQKSRLLSAAISLAKKLLNVKPGTLPTDLDPEAAINAKAAELASRLKGSINQGMDSASSQLRSLIAALSNIASYGDKASEIIAKAERAVDEIDKKVNTPALPPPSKSEYDDLLTPQVDKEKPEFDYWKPGEENPEQLKKKKQ